MAGRGEGVARFMYCWVSGTFKLQCDSKPEEEAFFSLSDHLNFVMIVFI